MNSGNQVLSSRIIGWYNWVYKCGHWYLFSDWHELCWISVFKLSIKQKTTKNTEKTQCTGILLQSKFEDTETHVAVFTAFSKRIHCEISDTHGIFLLFVFEVKIYCMQNALFRFHCWIYCCLSIVFTWQRNKNNVRSYTEHKQPHCSMW